jgi:hypothetical protein
MTNKWFVSLRPLILLILVVGCAPLQPAIAPPEQVADTLLMLRFAGHDRHDPPLQPYFYDAGGSYALQNTKSYLLFGLGDFDTGGKPTELNTPMGHFSSETRDEGWVYLGLKAGYHYLAFDGLARLGTVAPIYQPVEGHRVAPDHIFDDVPHWRIAVPPNADVVYGGSFYITGVRWEVFYDNDVLWGVDWTSMELVDESARAKEIARTYIPTRCPVITQMAQRQVEGTPIRLGLPPPVQQ